MFSFEIDELHLLARPERVVDDFAELHVLELRAHERTALAGLTCWKSTIVYGCPSKTIRSPLLELGR